MNFTFEKLIWLTEWLCMNFEGYIGDRTKAEIQYAQMVGKPVDYICPPTAGLLAEHPK
jgi:hypothetical protein